MNIFNFAKVQLSSQAETVLAQVKEYCEQENNAVVLLLKAWVVLRYALLPLEKKNDIAPDYLNDITSAVEDVEVPVEIRAECSFSVGINWERAFKYDIAKSLQFYRRALLFYYSSVAPSEADRLLNTWGHQKTLMLELAEAKRLIKRSLDIKKRKADIIGIAYSIGCLADNEMRQGKYQEALKYSS